MRASMGWLTLILAAFALGAKATGWRLSIRLAGADSGDGLASVAIPGMHQRPSTRNFRKTQENSRSVCTTAMTSRSNRQLSFPLIKKPRNKLLHEAMTLIRQSLAGRRIHSVFQQKEFFVEVIEAMTF